jgi:hypothetical protein
MAYTRTPPVANPDNIASGSTVTISFDATSLSGDAMLDIVYSSTHVSLDGSGSQARSRGITSFVGTIAEPFVITGPPGIWTISVATSVAGAGQQMDQVLVNVT